MNRCEKASQAIKCGGVVVVATETFYAIAADPLDAVAVEKVFRIKGRPISKPLPLIASDVGTVMRHLIHPHPRLLWLISHFWPGSVAMVLAVDIQMADGIMNNEGKIAVRVPPACPARRVAALADGWITATSANVSGDAPPDCISLVSDAILAGADMVLDTGPTPGGMPSTIIEVLDDGDCRVLREGIVHSDLIVHWEKPLTRV